MVTGLDRFARSLADLCELTGTLKKRQIILNVAGVAYNPATARGAVFFDTVAAVVDAEAALSRQRTRIARPATPPARPREKNRHLSDEKQENELVTLYESGDYTVSELAARFRLSRSAVYRIIERHTRNQRH